MLESRRLDTVGEMLALCTGRVPALTDLKNKHWTWKDFNLGNITQSWVSPLSPFPIPISLLAVLLISDLPYGI